MRVRADLCSGSTYGVSLRDRFVVLLSRPV